MRQPVARDEHRAEPEVQPLVGGAEHARDAADADPGEADDQGDDSELRRRADPCLQQRRSALLRVYPQPDEGGVDDDEGADADEPEGGAAGRDH